KAYGDKAYTTVERRAALDRLISQHVEYLLPVLVEDAWIPGLPKATAYLDLRRIGVLGVTDLLVQKVLGRKQPLIVPEGVRVPRVPRGALRGADLADHLIALSRDQDMALFGALIYDETTVALRHLLSDPVTWDALDVATGPNFELFALRDERLQGIDIELDTNVGLATPYSLTEARDKRYFYSHLLKDYFGEERTTLVYPSVLLFVVDHRALRKCWLIPGRRRATREESLNWLIDLCECVRDSIATSGGLMAPAATIVADLKRDLLARKHTLYIQSPPRDAVEAVKQLVEFMDQPAA
ncbi:MAG TPA: hypothetical protein VFK10_08690, partial [Burkholderiaceae bacterium]|nr:hypothetical protein [Burkholderiaceae bacterium]